MWVVGSVVCVVCVMCVGGVDGLCGWWIQMMRVVQSEASGSGLGCGW